MFETTAAAGYAVHVVELSEVVDSLAGSTVSSALNYFSLSSTE